MSCLDGDYGYPWKKEQTDKDRKQQEDRGVEDAQGHKPRALPATHWNLTLNLMEH